MIKGKKYLSKCIAIMMVGILILPSVGLAAENKVSAKTEIPINMEPSTVIKYISDNEYTILQGGEALIKKTKEKVESILPPEEYPMPEKGMMVYYGIDGEVNDIVFPSQASENKFVTLSDKEQSVMNSFIMSITASKASSSKPFATWGSYPNKLYYADSSRHIMGTGRATVFGDSIGQGNHKLKKGDVATKLKYDNCKLGLSVTVILPKKGSSSKLAKVMKKWDAGSMPNAVIDIWKTGINYCGYTYTSSSLSNWASGNAHIEHNNDMI